MPLYNRRNPRESSCFFYHVKTQWNERRGPKKRPLSRTQPCLHSDLRLAASRNKFLLFIRHTAYGSLLQSPNGLRWASRWQHGKESACHCRRCWFDPWVRTIHWSRKWKPMPVFLPGKLHGQRSLMGYNPWGSKESDMTECTHAYNGLRYQESNLIHGHRGNALVWCILKRISITSVLGLILTRL